MATFYNWHSERGLPLEYYDHYEFPRYKEADRLYELEIQRMRKDKEISERESAKNLNLKSLIAHYYKLK